MKMCPAAKLGGQFGDTTYTKVFVGGLAWETQSETLKKYFDQFGEILEAVVISDKATGRSKGYGFVTFREAEAARKACEDAAPVIDGRMANCNIASFGAVQRSKPSTPKHAGGGGDENVRIMMKAAGFTSTASLTATPHYAIPQGIPLYSYFGYRTHSSDYTYPSSYYNVYGASVHGSGPAFYPYLQQPGGLGSCYTTCGVQQYPAHYLYGNYSSPGGYPQHNATMPMSLAPAAMSLPSSAGVVVALQAPVPISHC